MKYLDLPNGQRTLVDDDVYEWAKSYKWQIDSTGYVRTTLFLHRLVVNTPLGKYTDHKNGDKLDNRRGNLRVCTGQQNMYNRRKLPGEFSSCYKGVSFVKEKGDWRAEIFYSGKRVLLGHFKEERWAAMAYDLWISEYAGEFAKHNFPGATIGIASH